MGDQSKSPRGLSGPLSPSAPFPLPISMMESYKYLILDLFQRYELVQVVSCLLKMAQSLNLEDLAISSRRILRLAWCCLSDPLGCLWCHCRCDLVSRATTALLLVNPQFSGPHPFRPSWCVQHSTCHLPFTHHAIHGMIHCCEAPPRPPSMPFKVKTPHAMTPPVCVCLSCRVKKEQIETPDTCPRVEIFRGEYIAIIYGTWRP
jgi:hypothetical protein